MADLSNAKIVELTWLDAHAENAWMDIEDLDQESYQVKSIGWLMTDAKPDHVVLAQSIGVDHSVDGVLCVPVGMVVKIRIVLPTDFR
jgi:hypothetical protein